MQFDFLGFARLRLAARSASKLVPLAILGLGLAACDGGNEGNGGDNNVGGDPCDNCEEGEHCLSHFPAEGDEYEACVTTPSECGGTVDCSNTDCQRAAYEQCDEGFIGAGCSESVADLPAFISCNE